MTNFLIPPLQAPPFLISFARMNNKFIFPVSYPFGRHKCMVPIFKFSMIPIPKSESSSSVSNLKFTISW